MRIAEHKEHDALKGHKYTFLKNRENLSDKKEKELDELIKLYPTLGEAYRLKVLSMISGKCPTSQQRTLF